MMDASRAGKSPKADRVGQVLKGKWTLTRLLGRGGMATVYEAHHRNGDRVAVKILHRELCENQKLRARFLREGYAANAVGHPGVVRVRDDDIAEDESAFLVMELLRGEPLDERCKRLGTLTPKDVFRVADQLLDVLAAAHENGVIHRDVKPSNLFWTEQGEIKVLDFGIAHLADPLDGAGKVTRTGTMMGTPSYMPPEQARGRWDEVDARSDVWAVGATMYWLLTGKPIRRAATSSEIWLAAMTDPVPSLAEAGAGLSPSLVALVDRALSFDRDARFPTARAMQTALRGVVLDSSMQNATEPLWAFPVVAQDDTLPAPPSAATSTELWLSSANTVAPSSDTQAPKLSPERRASQASLQPRMLILGGCILVLLATTLRHEPSPRPASHALVTLPHVPPAPPPSVDETEAAPTSEPANEAPEPAPVQTSRGIPMPAPRVVGAPSSPEPTSAPSASPKAEGGLSTATLLRDAGLDSTCSGLGLPHLGYRCSSARPDCQAAAAARGCQCEGATCKRLCCEGS